TLSQQASAPKKIGNREEFGWTSRPRLPFLRGPLPRTGHFGGDNWSWYTGWVVAAHCSDPPLHSRAGKCNESALRPGSSVVERGPEKAGFGGSIPSLATI